MAKNLNLALPRLKTLAKAGDAEPKRKAKPAVKAPPESATTEQTPTVKPPPEKTAAVFSYVVASTCLDAQGRLRQLGSGPNYQGGLITLTTCKRRMRAALEVEAWPGQWIVGLSGNGLHEGRQWLVFVTQIERAFASHAELVKALPPEVRRAKSSRLSVHGDLFEPLRAVTDEEALEPGNYHPPIVGHLHQKPEKWHKDIHYPSWQRPAALLVGDPKRSFLWTEPTLFYRGEGGQLRQGYKKWLNLSEFVKRLEVAR